MLPPGLEEVSSCLGCVVAPLRKKQESCLRLCGMKRDGQMHVSVGTQDMEEEGQR